MLLPRLPTEANSITLILALIGGIGGTVTILCYAYWLREQGSEEPRQVSHIRFDLGVAYLLTTLFGMAVIIIAAGVNPKVVQGYGMILGMAEQLGESLGLLGRGAFLIGFWGAVFSSMLGVWHGVPYLFADFIQQYRSRGKSTAAAEVTIHSKPYRFFLFYLAIPPILLVLFEKPVWIGIAYSVAGAFFMPFLAALLLYMNNRTNWMGQLANGWVTNLLLLLSLVLFLFLFLAKL